MDLYIFYAVIGFIVLLYGLISKILKFIFMISEPVFALTLGLLFGQLFLLYASPILAPGTWFLDGVDEIEFIHEVSRISLVASLMNTALKLPRFFIFRALPELIYLLVIIMGLMLISGGLFAFALLQIPIEQAILVGAIATSTDPVVAAVGIEGKFAKKRASKGVRHLLSAESGANDGLAYLYVYLPLLFTASLSAEQAMSFFWVKIVLYDILVTAILAFSLGFVIGQVIILSQRFDLVDKESLLAFTLGFTLFVMGVFRLLNMNDILAVFVAGIGFTTSHRQNEVIRTDGIVQESIDTFVTVVYFFILGIFVPYQGWFNLGWRGAVAAGLIVLLRRIQYIVLSYPLLKRYIPTIPDAMFYGWFGPIGVSAIFYATLVAIHLRGIVDQPEYFWWIGSEIVVLSTYVHGITTPISLYGLQLSKDRRLWRMILGRA